MNIKAPKILQWFIVLIYIGIIYATLGVGPRLWEFVDAFFSGFGVQVAYGIFSVLFVSYLTYMIFIRKEKFIYAYCYYVTICLTFILLNFYTKHPAEKIHLFEYFILGILVLNAMGINKNVLNLKQFIIALLFCALAGIFDEVIQYFLPNRVFDWRDIGLNLTSSLLAFLFVERVTAKQARTSTKG